MSDITIDEKRTMREIAGRIKEIRGRLELSRLRMADMLGVSYSSMGKYLNGTQMVGLSVLLRLSAYLGVSLDWLLIGHGEMMRDEGEARKQRMEPLVESLLEDEDLCRLVEGLIADAGLRYDVLNYFFKVTNGAGDP